MERRLVGRTIAAVEWECVGSDTADPRAPVFVPRFRLDDGSVVLLLTHEVEEGSDYGTDVLVVPNRRPRRSKA